LIPQIKKILPPDIQIIDSGEAVAKQTYNLLKEKVGLASIEKREPVFYTNSNPKVLSEILGNKYEIIEKDF
jgi:glutamate racemase